MKSRIIYTRSRESEIRRKSRLLRFTAAGAAVLILVLVGAVFAMRTPSWRIQKITLSGAKSLDEPEVRANIRIALAGTRAYILPRASFFLADTGAIASDLQRDFPRIRDAVVTKEFPDKLNVAITERVFWGVFCNGLQGSSTPVCAYIDSGGVAYEYAPEPQGKLIITIRTDADGDSALSASAVDSVLMAEIRSLAENIPAQTGIALADFELRSRIPGEIRAIAADGFTMIFKREDDYAATLHVLKRVLDGEIKEKRNRLDYIDLRFGNKVFYKMR